MKKIIFILILVVAAAIGAVAIWQSSPQWDDEVKVQPAKIKDVKELAQLCTVEVYEDMPMKGRVGTRHIFARITMRGTISFDLDKMEIVESGDTLKVTLPKETVEVLEATTPDAYQVIDTWNEKFLGSDNMTAAEENKLKKMASERFKNRIYNKGYVTRAREEAAANLQSILSTMTGKTVVVTSDRREKRGERR